VHWRHEIDAAFRAANRIQGRQPLDALWRPLVEAYGFDLLGLTVLHQPFGELVSNRIRGE
jgi:hypothetical protein